jgi:hypothetical protein
MKLWGCFERIGTEIIPFEPDAVSTAGGKSHSLISGHLPDSPDFL